MEAVRQVEGRAYPFGRKNVDTDLIIPAAMRDGVVEATRAMLDTDQAIPAGDAMLKFNKGSGTNLAVRGGVPSREEAVRTMRRWLRRGRRREDGAWRV